MTVALYAGSFDPPTLGHLDIITRAAAACERVLVGIGYNPNKSPYLSIESRIELLEGEIADRGLNNVTIQAFTGATVAFAREHQIDVLIRGLRNVGDLDNERGLSEVNRANGFDSLYFLAASEHAHLSSHLVRDVIAAGLGLDQLVSPRVAELLIREKS